MAKSTELTDLMNSLYQCVSGQNAKQRNWDLFLSLFHPQARMVVLNPNGKLEVFTPSEFRDSFIERVGDENFGEHETENSHFIDGSVATIWSKYSAKGVIGATQLEYEGYNSIQAIHYQGLWKILNMFWERSIDI